MSDLSRVPEKYLDIQKNYSRAEKVLNLVKTKRYSKGLDFGCGMGFCTVLGHVHGIEIVGMDIPSVGGTKRNRKGIRPTGPSPYLSMQENLKKLGYPVLIADTTEYPWAFSDDEFDFIIGWFAITKQHMDKEDWSVEDRINELMRVTKKSGHWFLFPKSHVNVAHRFDNPKDIEMVLV